MSYNDDFRRANIDRMLAEHDLDRRRSRRARPVPPSGVFFIWHGRSHQVHDISAGGFAFAVEEPLDAGWRLAGGLALPGLGAPLEVKALVVGPPVQGMARCQFEAMGREALAAVEGYVEGRSRETAALVDGLGARPVPAPGA